MNLINPDYSYNYNQFTGNNGTWKLIAIDGSPRLSRDAVDTFTNIETGRVVETVRHKVYRLAIEGKIHPSGERIGVSSKKRY